jgi:hypothetical protein
MMKTFKHLAGLALAVSALALNGAAQIEKPQPPPPGPGPGDGLRLRKGERAEVRIENRDDRGGGVGFGYGFGGDLDHNTQRLVVGGGEQMDQPLIVSTGGLDDGAVANLEEDLTIMARILEKSVNRSSGGPDNSAERKAMGIHLWSLGQGNRGARNLYIDGHGAIFILNANIPLGGPSPKQPAEEKKESPNSAWESARNEVFGDEDGEPRKGRRERIGPAFDPARLDALKKSVIDSLKNASNIRGLKDNEMVTVVFQGAGGPGAWISAGGGGGGSGGGAGGGAGSGNFRLERNNKPGKMDIFAFAGPDQRRGPRNLLTLRAKKSDIDAFSKGKLDEDEFRKKVTVSSYKSSGGADSPRGK